MIRSHPHQIPQKISRELLNQEMKYSHSGILLNQKYFTFEGSTINSRVMKKNLMILSAAAFIFGFTSCRDTPSNDSQEVDILESPEETTIEEAQEEEDTIQVDSVETDTLEEGETDTLTVEQ